MKQYNHIKTEEELKEWYLIKRSRLNKGILFLINDHHEELKIIEEKFMEKQKEVKK